MGSSSKLIKQLPLDQSCVREDTIFQECTSRLSKASHLEFFADAPSPGARAAEMLLTQKRVGQGSHPHSPQGCPQSPWEGCSPDVTPNGCCRLAIGSRGRVVRRGPSCLEPAALVVSEFPVIAGKQVAHSPTVWFSHTEETVTFSRGERRGGEDFSVAGITGWAVREPLDVIKGLSPPESPVQWLSEMWVLDQTNCSVRGQIVLCWL